MASGGNPGRHPRGRRATWAGILVVLIVALAGFGCSPSTPPRPFYHYSAVWQGKPEMLSKVSNPPLDQLAKATFAGQVYNFQTDNPAYSCFANKALYVYLDAEIAQFQNQYVVYSVCASTSVAGTSNGVSGVWTFAQPKPTPTPQFSYTALFEGRSVQLSYIPNGTLPQGTPLISQVTQFATTDPSFACLTNVPIHVWSGLSQYPGEYVAFAGCPGGPSGFWTFVISYNYTATFGVDTIALTPVIADPTPPTSTPSGEITAFTSDDPAYTCQSGASLSYYVAPEELQRINVPPGDTTFVVYGGCLGNVAGVWTFVGPSSQVQYQYFGRWRGVQVALTPVTTVPPGAVALTGQFLTNFSTTDPFYSCFNGANLQAWKVPNAPAKQLLAYDVCGQGRFGAFTFQAP